MEGWEQSSTKPDSGRTKVENLSHMHDLQILNSAPRPLGQLLPLFCKLICPNEVHFLFYFPFSNLKNNEINEKKIEESHGRYFPGDLVL